MGWILVAAVVVALLVWWRRRQAEPFRAMILLYRHPVALDAGRLREAADRAGVTIQVVSDEEPIMGTVGSLPVAVFSGSEPYGPPGQGADWLADRAREFRLQATIREHRGWVSFAPPPATPAAQWEQGLPDLVKLATAFADEHATIVWRTDTNEMGRLTPELRERLEAGEVRALAEWAGDEISPVDGNDPRMVAAVAEARERWPEFVAAVGRIGTPSDTICKAPFTDGLNTEFMWVEVHRADADSAEGTLSNAPFRVYGLRQGSTVKVRSDEISDWAYVENGEAVGAFTEKIIRGG